jgi:hypothetical protein
MSKIRFPADNMTQTAAKKNPDPPSSPAGSLRSEQTRANAVCDTEIRNRDAPPAVMSLRYNGERENSDAPETDFHRRFPHEPLQEQTEEAAGQALSRTGPALLKFHFATGRRTAAGTFLRPAMLPHRHRFLSRSIASPKVDPLPSSPAPSSVTRPLPLWFRSAVCVCICPHRPQRVAAIQAFAPVV